MKNRPAWLLGVLVICLATMAIPYLQPKALEGIAVGLVGQPGQLRRQAVQDAAYPGSLKAISTNSRTTA